MDVSNMDWEFFERNNCGGNLKKSNGKNNMRSLSGSHSGGENWEHRLPFDIRAELGEEFLEVGQSSLSQQYFEALLEKAPAAAQDLLQNIYYTAVQYRQHTMAWNIMVVLSQLSYDRMIPWASFMALTATRSPYRDIQELGIRCFENWEDKPACRFLQGCAFEEKWLQEYAEEVCEYVMEEGKEHVLFEKNQPWQVAEGTGYSKSHVEGYSHGYCDSGIQNRAEQTLFMGG